MSDYIIRLEEGVKLSDICDIEDDGCMWINHHYANGLGETTPDTMAIELPAHGRLVDMDILKETIASIARKELAADESWIQMLHALDNAPTILEATNE